MYVDNIDVGPKVEGSVDLLETCRETGAKIKFFRKGDVGAALATCLEETGVNISFGVDRVL